MNGAPILRALRDATAVIVVALFMFPLFWWGLTSIKPTSAIFNKDKVVFFDFKPTAINYAVTLLGKSRSSFGTAAVSEPAGQFTALLPATALGDLHQARSLRIVLPGNRWRAVPVARLRMRLATDSAVRRAGLAPSAEPGILLTGRVALARLPGALAQHGRFVTSVALVLRSQPIAGVLARELAVIFGQREAGQ